MRRRAVRAARGPPGLNQSGSTPHGTTDIRNRSRPSRINSNTSALQLAVTQVASRATRASNRDRPGGLVSAVP